MHKLLRLFVGTLPVCGLGFLAAAGPSLPHPSAPPSALECRQRKSASLNKTSRIILVAQYRFYEQNRNNPDLAASAVALYNQCVADSAPSALSGTGLPPHLP